MINIKIKYVYDLSAVVNIMALAKMQVSFLFLKAIID